MSDETRIHNIIVKDMDAAVDEVRGFNLAPEAFAVQALSYLIGGLVLGKPRWIPEQVADVAKACAERYAERLKQGGQH
jgi:hypothetical protein